MARFDRTGPLGNGPMTGRGLGRCNTNYKSTPSIPTGNPSRGLGRGRSPGGGRGIGLGRGRSLGNRFNRGV